MENKNWSDFEKYLVKRLDSLESRLTNFQIKVYSSVFVLAGIVEAVKWVLENKK